MKAAPRRSRSRAWPSGLLCAALAACEDDSAPLAGSGGAPSPDSGMPAGGAGSPGAAGHGAAAGAGAAGHDARDWEAPCRASCEADLVRELMPCGTGAGGSSGAAGSSAAGQGGRAGGFVIPESELEQCTDECVTGTLALLGSFYPSACAGELLALVACGAERKWTCLNDEWYVQDPCTEPALAELDQCVAANQPSN